MAAEMVECEIDGVEILETDSILIGNHRVHKKYEDDYIICEYCGALEEISNGEWINDEWICQSCIDDNYSSCVECGDYVHNDNAIEISNGDIICQDCYERSYFTCDNCGSVYHNDDYGGDGYCINCYEDDEDGECYDKDGAINSTSYEDAYGLGEQKKIPIPENLENWLNDFYNDRHSFNYISETKSVYLESSVEMNTEFARKIFNDWAKGYGYGVSIVPDVYSTFKYYDAFNVSCEGPKVTYSIIDNLGRVKTNVESIFTVYNYYKRILGESFTGKVTAEDCSNVEFKLVLSNDLDHKIKLANANGSAFSSCQTSDNRGGYARGMWDWFNNGCNVPIAITKGGEIIGRTLCRLMYNGDGKEYLFVDRTYLNSRYSNERISLIRGIINELREHYDLALPNRSEHDSSTYDLYGETDLDLGLESLRQPYRHNNEGVNRAYYHDSYTKTYTNTQGTTIYDKIGKELYYILPKKN